MEDPSKATSCNHQRSSPNAALNDPPSKRRKSSMLDTPGYPTPPPQNRGVLKAVNKLMKLVKRHPQFHSKLEGMLEVEVSAAVKKEKMKVLVRSTVFQMTPSSTFWICR